MKNMEPKKDESDEYEMIVYFNQLQHALYVNQWYAKYIYSFNKNEQRIKKNHFE